MAEDTPSSVDSAQHSGSTGTQRSDEISSSAPSAPSDFLTHLPSSAVPTFSDQDAPSSDATPGSAPPAQNGEPPKLQVDAQGRTLNPRSCVTCRKRKVKCDKTHPCSNCNRAHIECVFPSPGRAPRKARKAGEGRDKELLERLRRLEGVVKGMGVEVPDRQEKEGIMDVESQGSTEQGTRVESVEDELPDGSSVLEKEANMSLSQKYHEQNHVEKTKWVEENQKGRFENRFGRLVVNEGKSRYINNSFWASLSNEVEDLKGILNQSSDDEDDVPSPGTTHVPGNHQGFVFGFSSQNINLLSLHPLPGQIQAYWNTYKDRVDPLVKVLHIPTIESTILSASSHLSNLSKGFEALLFAIYYGATTSLNPADCLSQFGEERSVLLSRYRFAIEQALARANFLTTEEIIVLQAFVIFLICLRRNNDARVIWTLTGLVVRIAQTIGVHRDGSHFGLTPFEVEMRRRLWWQVCILDTRASEDHGCDPTIIEQAFDTKMPLNINDVDISPDMKEFPPERQGCTDISFCLIRFEVANTFRRINYIPPGAPRACNEFYANVTLQDKEKWITECHQRLEERYLKHCDMSVPIFWVTATVARLMMSKMWLMVYHPFQRQDGGASLPSETKEKLFITSLENIEYSILLETEARTMKWGWLFKTYMQWHALAFILSELCWRTNGDLAERAWTAVEKTRDGRWGMRMPEDIRAGHLWRPLKKLYRKAKEARQRGVQEAALNRGRNMPPQRTYSPNANPMFEHPNRPRMTRAPLSQAQLKRFTNGPEYGQMPLDKHELLKSPQLSETSGQDEVNPMDTSNMQTDGVQQLLPQNLDQDMLAAQGGAMSSGFGGAFHGMSSAAPTNGQHVFAPTAMPQSGPGFGRNFIAQTYPNPLSGTSNIDFTDFDPNATATAGTSNHPLVSTSTQNNPMRSWSVDSNMGNTGFDASDLDTSIMDTSGDLNWENWDQLVKQFGMGGMDVDSAPGAGLATDWAGGNWEMLTNGANLRMGMGMGGGDWF